MNSNGFNINRRLIQHVRKQTGVKRARGDSGGYLLSRKSAAMGSDISMWDDSSLYTSPCSRSGRKFKIFWSTISDWCEKGSQTMVSLSGDMSRMIMLQQKKSKTGDLIVTHRSEFWSLNLICCNSIFRWGQFKTSSGYWCHISHCQERNKILELKSLDVNSIISYMWVFGTKLNKR